MDDLISRQAATDAINRIECTRYTTWYEFYQKVITAVGELPPAQPDVTEEEVKDYCRKRCLTILTNDCFHKILEEERESGEWIIADTQNEEDVQNGNYRYICSCCGYSDTHSKAVRVPYCWHCGADMREGEEDGN